MQIDNAAQFGTLNSLHQRYFQKVSHDDSPQGNQNQGGPKELTLEQFTKLREKIAEETGNSDLASNAAEDFAAMDTDGSGTVSRQEIHKFLHQQFKAPSVETTANQIDAGGLTVLIDQQEVSNEDLQAIITRFDGDGSETLNQTELAQLKAQLTELSTAEPWAQEIETLFGAIDADGDGEITLAEFGAYLQQRLAQALDEPTTEDPLVPVVTIDEETPASTVVKTESDIMEV